MRVVSTRGALSSGGLLSPGEVLSLPCSPPCATSAAVRATKRRRESPTWLCCAGGEAAAPELLQKKTKPLERSLRGPPIAPSEGAGALSSPSAPSSMVLEGHCSISTPLLPPGFAAVELVLPQGWDPPPCFVLMRKINVTSSSTLFCFSFPLKMARHSQAGADCPQLPPSLQGCCSVRTPKLWAPGPQIHPVRQSDP